MIRKILNHTENIVAWIVSLGIFCAGLFLARVITNASLLPENNFISFYMLGFMMAWLSCFLVMQPFLRQHIKRLSCRINMTAARFLLKEKMQTKEYILTKKTAFDKRQEYVCYSCYETIPNYCYYYESSPRREEIEKFITTLKQGGVGVEVNKQYWELNEKNLFCLNCVFELKKKGRTIVPYLDDEIARKVFSPMGLIVFGVLFHIIAFTTDDYANRISSYQFVYDRISAGLSTMADLDFWNYLHEDLVYFKAVVHHMGWVLMGFGFWLQMSRFYRKKGNSHER